VATMNENLIHFLCFYPFTASMNREIPW